MSNIVLVTGASQGIGYGIAEKFHAKGWEVLSLSRKALTGKESWSPTADSHFVFDLEDVELRSVDITLAVEHIDDVIAEIKHKLAGRPLNALINNAGISPKLPNGDRIGVNSADLEFWQRIFNVNVFAPAQLSRGLYENLKAAKGAVVNITSIVVQRVHPFAGSPYAASKAPKTQQVVDTAVPMRRLGSPAEIADTAYFLCSEESSYITGTEILVNGGQHL